MTRKLLSLALITVFTAAASGAQQTAKTFDDGPASTKIAMEHLSHVTADVKLVGINGLNCPVFASAERGGGGALVQTRQGEPASPVAELHMHFASSSRSEIKEVTITLHGTDARPRAELAYSSSSRPLSEEFHLTSSDRTLTHALVNPKKVVNVRWIGISDVEFADGSTWHSSENSYCHVQPNGFQRIASGR